MTDRKSAAGVVDLSWARPLDLQAYLADCAAAVERYRERGRVAALAAEAAEKVGALFPRNWQQAASLYGWQVGCSASEPAAMGDPRAARAACAALACELQRWREAEEHGRRGGRPAEPIAALRARWQAIRAHCRTDTDADKRAALDAGYERLTWQALARRRREHEKERGRWHRPT